MNVSIHQKQYKYEKNVMGAVWNWDGFVTYLLRR